MQTFLPYSDIQKSAESLDKKRCWKQIVEAKQIINVLEGKTTAWQNHPAVKMWVGHTDLLKHYYNIFLHHCVEVHKINTKLWYYECKYSEGTYDEKNGSRLFLNVVDILDVNELPWWFGQEQFHRSHRARLIEKNKEFYIPKFPEDSGYNDGKYWWPNMEDKTFKII